ncbi:MAG: hypothetical protein ABSG31_17555 [Tepidisphaeraceae bacterium]|jgi:probable HAF family extracellular repeat protein
MRILFSMTVFWGIAVAVSLNATCASAADQYSLTDLGSFTPTGLNTSGQICGNIPATGGTTHAAIYDNGSIQDLGVLPGYTSSFANDINSGAQVVGYQTVPNDPFNADYAFLFSDGTMLDMTTLPIYSGGTAMIARGINSLGQVVGEAAWNNSQLGGFRTGYGFLYSNGVVSPSPLNFNFLNGGGGTGGDSFAINDSGQIAGVGYDYYGGFPSAALSTGLQETSIFSSSDGGEIASSATAINGAGQVLGQVSGRDISSFSFLYSDDRVQTLSLTASQYADGLNDEGQVVGAIGNDAALYDGSETIDLNTLIPANSGWTLEDATAINDSGQIVGVGMSPGGQTDGFLLTPSVPVPEPLAVSILALASLVLIRRPRYVRNESVISHGRSN